LITDRMLKMFKRTPKAGEAPRWSPGTGTVLLAAVLLAGILGLIYALGGLREVDPKAVLDYLYILSAVLFILGLKGLSSPKWARRGMFLAELGMLVAIIGTLCHPDIKDSGYIWI